MDPRIAVLKSAFSHQYGTGFEFPVYAGRAQYGHGINIPVFAGRGQCGGGFGDVLRGIWRFFRPIAVSGASTLLKAGGEALKDGTTVKEVLKQTLKPTIGAVLGATGEQVANHFAEKPTAAPPPGPPTEMPGAAGVGTQRGSGKRKSVYKRKKSQAKRLNYYQYQHPIRTNF